MINARKIFFYPECNYRKELIETDFEQRINSVYSKGYF